MMRPILSTVAAAALLFSPTGLALAAPGAHGGGAGGAHANGATNPTANTGTAANTSATTSATTDTTLRGPAQTGQPNQSCGSATAPNTPGNAASAPGSAFNPGGTAGAKYAGQQPQNSNNTASVSQYDAACSHQPK